MNKFEDIKVGDYVTEIYQNQPQCIKKVTRLTKTQIVTSGPNKQVNETKWKKDNGRQIGSSGGFWFRTIEPTTKEHRDALRKRDLVYRINVLTERDKLNKMRVDLLENIHYVLTGESE